MTTQSHDDVSVPRPVLMATGALLIAVMAAVGTARLTDAPLAATPPSGTEDVRGTVVLSLQNGGGIEALDPASGAVMAALPVGGDGFLRGILRALDRIRGQHGVALDAPVDFIRWTDGRVTMIDPATGWRIELKGFGPDNLATVSLLLDRIAAAREAT